LALAVAKPGAVLLSVEPSFCDVQNDRGIYRMNYVGVPLTEDFELDLSATLTAIKQHHPVLVSCVPK